MIWKVGKSKSPNQSRRQKAKLKKKNESNKRDPWDNRNPCIIGIPEGEEREKEIKNIFEEIMAENFSNLKKETDIQVQEAQRAPNKMNPNRTTPRHIIITTAKIKDKEKILKAARKELITREPP